MPQPDILANLNASQKAAVSSVADTLGILAGPGSGKTHTLTSRTAWLLQQGLQPWNIIVATFTVKAAREMKERIGKLIGNGLESKLVLGTFHSIARRYLARYGHLIDIAKDFGIADSADSLAIIKRICKTHKMNINPKVARSRISGHKSRGPDHADIKTTQKKSVEVQEYEICYSEYEAALQRSNLLDYDDLLLRCVDLLRAYPSCVSNVEAVLIDEFQDTNLVQFDLMRLFAAHRKRITIVGDPDQSIYGFRAAETKNYKRMLAQYPDTVTIPLEENYRSSGAILLTALGIIEQDTSRISKSLMPTHTVGTRPVFRKLNHAQKEAEWIVTEITRCIGMTGDLLDLDDFAILLRSASLSRLIESELGKAGLPYRMVGGLRFYDRVEVKTVLDYLRVIEQPGNNDALSRVINIPSRGIGESTVKALLEEADASKTTLWALVLGFVQGNRAPKTKLRKQAEKGLTKLVNIVLTARRKLDGKDNKTSAIVDSIKLVLEKTNYEEWLREHHNDAHKARWDNVQELITQASDFQNRTTGGFEDESLPDIEGLDQLDESNTLARFLANVALASEIKKGDDKRPPTAQITISTIHAAKGLEWPIVFIPAAYQGSIPHSRAEDTDEERRLLYVAMTRAQALLYMSCPLKNSQGEQTTISPFLSDNNLARLLDRKGPSFQSSTIASIYHILRRDRPSLKSIADSSANLPSQEDNLFANGNDNIESRRDLVKDGKPRFASGQQPAKRRKVDTSSSNVFSSTIREKTYETTMEKLNDFVTASTAMKSAFLTAGTHLQVMKRSTANENSEASSQRNVTEKDLTTAKSPRTSSTKSLEGSQATLLGFLGKTASTKVTKRPALSPKNDKPPFCSRENRNIASVSTGVCVAGNIKAELNKGCISNSSPTSHEVQAIGMTLLPLAQHHVGARPGGVHPRSHIDTKDQDGIFAVGHIPGPGKRPRLLRPPGLGLDFPSFSSASSSASVADDHNPPPEHCRNDYYCFLSSSPTVLSGEACSDNDDGSRKQMQREDPHVPEEEKRRLADLINSSGVAPTTQAFQGKDRAVRLPASLHPTTVMAVGQGSRSNVNLTSKKMGVGVGVEAAVGVGRSVGKTLGIRRCAVSNGYGCGGMKNSVNKAFVPPSMRR